MRLVFPTSSYFDPTTPRSWSGLPYFIRRTLEAEGFEVVPLPLTDGGRAGSWVRFALWRLLGRRYLRGPAALRGYARQLERRLPDLEADAIFSPSSWFISYVQTELPMFFWTDACFAGMVDFYPSFSRLAAPSIRAAHAAEQAALERCSRAIYCSDWAAEIARTRYRVDPAKVAVVPFGANLRDTPERAEVEAAIAARPDRPCRLLLVGVDWARKGADLAVEAVESVRARGLEATLTVVGCRPPRARLLPPSVELIPFIGKETPEGHRRLAEIFSRSHFFIMPSRAEAYGLVYAEANAFGVPCLASRTGGLGAIVRDGVNGRLFDPEAKGAAYADYILELMASPERYRALALRSAGEFRERLSWAAAGVQVRKIIEEGVNEGPVGAVWRGEDLTQA